MEKAKRWIINGVIIVLIVCGVAWVCSMFVHFGSGEFTDNAQVCEEKVLVNSRIQGFVKKVLFDDFVYVNKGDTLLLIEDVEYRLQYAQAEAGYRNALIDREARNTAIRTTENNISVSDAALEEARILMNNAQKEYERYKNLLAKESVTQQQYDAVETQYNSLKAKYETMLRQQQTTRLVKSEQTQRLDQNSANIAVAEAALRLAELNLSYTVITAPCDGYTSRKTVEEGALIQPGQQLLSVIDDSESWVIANFREKQLKNIEIGSLVEISVDAIPDILFRGKVTAISEATGAQYSVVPQDNSTGNFVKIEQKIPVKIAFGSDNEAGDLAKLHSGMNVECRVLAKE